MEMEHVKRICEMTVQDRIDRGMIDKRFAEHYKEASVDEIKKDYPFVGRKFESILGGAENDRIVILKDKREERSYDVILYTAENMYSITVKPDYIGCISGTRTREPLEDWNRGHDLHDGKCTEDTLEQVLMDILRDEIVPFDK